MKNDDSSLNKLNQYEPFNEESSVTSIEEFIDNSIPGDFSFNHIMDSLEDAASMYKYLFENNPNAMYIWDVETLCIIDCNEEALLKYGYTRSEFLNLTISDLQYAEDAIPCSIRLQ